ncbi:MAG: hypothetical protein JHD02_06475 [Thermoleophilaceae bacterium]|nr:hypothetical protein [Thermoleophilaceae bacterium]
MKRSKRNRRSAASDHIPYVLPVEGGFFGREYPYIDIPGLADGEVATFIGNPDTDFSKKPLIRDATLDDCDHDCPECERMRKQILSGKKVKIADYSLSE